MNFPALLITASILLQSPRKLPDHIWSKSGTLFELVFENEEIGKLPPIRLSSPDHQTRLNIYFDSDSQHSAVIHAFATNRQHHAHIALDDRWNQAEIVWAPDSQSFAITGAFNAYTNSTRIYSQTVSGYKAVSLRAVRQDMVNLFPPCKADNPSDMCHQAEDGHLFNYATLAWLDNNTVVIMAEVPCSSSQGGIMCQVEGYEFNIETGEITSRMTARELKQKWQHALAFELTIPDPPIWKHHRKKRASPQ